MRCGMSVLASLLVRDQLIAIDRIQEAIQEQVMRGGNLDTVLLELGYLTENQMSAYCAAVYGLMPATRAEIMDASVETIRVLPREFAVKHRLIPLARAEDAIVLAVDRPLPDAILREICFELGVDPAQRVACSVRIEAGLAKHYDIEMTARMRKLGEELDRASAGVVPFVAPFEGAGKRSSLPPRKKQISGSYPRLEPSIPAPVDVAETEPPSTSVPAGTFGDSRPASPHPSPPPSTSGFVDATRYSLPPRPPELLGRPASHRVPARGATEPAEAPSTEEASGSHSGPARSPRAEPDGQGRRHRHLPTDPRRDNDGSAITHDIVSLGPNVPSYAPRSIEAEPADVQGWSPAPPPKSERELPSVIVDVGEHVESLIETLADVGPEDETFILPLLAAGEGALPALAREFPGKLWFDRATPHVRIPDGRDRSAVARTLVAFGQRSVPYLIPLLDHADSEVRYYAALVSAEFVHPDLVSPIGERLYDPDGGVRGAAYRALSVLYACEAEFAELVRRLRGAARDGRKLPRQIMALEALGRLRDIESFEFLVSLLDSPQSDVIRAAHASLVRLSCQDFGTAKKKWLGWYRKNDHVHRVQWLIEALTHPDERLRRRAGAELKHLTQEYFGYHSGLPKRERDAAQRKYRRWWQEVGSRIFTQPERDSSGHARRW